MNAGGDAHTSHKEEIDAADQPVYQSKLRAKREQRIQQQRQQLLQDGDVSSTPESSQASAAHSDTSAQADTSSNPSVEVSEASHAAISHTQRTMLTTRSTTDDIRRRQRAEARRLLIDYPGTVWDVVQTNDVLMLRNFFLVEGAAKLVLTHRKKPEEFGRTLLHTAAWWGSFEAAQFLLVNGASVDQIDTTATRLTPLMDAARAGHAHVGILLVGHGADATLIDSSGDNAFHWAARHSQGDFLLQVSLALDARAQSALVETWTSKNIRGRTPADYIRSHNTIFPMISKRLGARVPLSPSTTQELHRFRLPNTPLVTSLSTTADIATVVASLDTHSTFGVTLPVQDRETARSRPSSAQIATQAATGLSGVDALRLDVSSFAYKSHDSISSH